MVVNLSWETRIASAQTVESIMKSLNEVDLMSEFFVSDGDETVLRLDDFNLTELLRKSQILLSSDTQKYDSKDADTSSSSTSSPGANMSGQMSDKLRQQRHLLNLKLGIDVGGAAKLDTTHIFSDYDIISSSVQDTELDTSDLSRSKRRLAEMPAAVLPFIPLYFRFRFLRCAKS